MSLQFSGRQEVYPARTYAPAVGDFRKAATAVVFQGLIAGVLNTIAVQGDDGTVIANQATALGTNQIIINAAITYVNGLGGGSVFIEQSTYLQTGPVLPLSNVFIYGAGPDTVLDGQNLAHAIDINAQNYIMIWNLTCQTTTGGGGLFNAINIQGGCTFIKVETVLIAQSDQDGVAITNADSEIWISDTAIQNVDRFGINNDGDDCRIFNNEVTGAIGNDGIFLGVNSDGNYVLNNHIHAWTGEPIDDDGDNTVEGNICCVAGVAPIAWNSKGCGFATVQATIDHQISNGEISIIEGTHTVAGGVITLVAANTGLQIKGAGKLVTTLSSSTRHCIQITAGLNIVIRDLAFQTTGVAQLADGVAILGASIAIFVIDCVCLDCDQDAISIVAASSECFIRRNYLYSNIDRYGINNAGDNNIISGNRINGTGSDGIWLQAGGTYCIVLENRVSGWGGEGIDNDEPTNQVDHNITAV